MDRPPPETRGLMAPAKGEIFLEIVIQGAFAKATAIDSASGIEASIVGPASASRDALGEAARRKLKYLIKKRNPLSS
jgi:hypothetical protein